MPVPPSISHASTTLSVGSSTSSSSAQNPSIVHRLLESVPEHAVHLLERLFAPNTMLYSPPHNDPHDSEPTSPTSPVQEEGAERPRRRSSVVSKGKEACSGVENVVEVNGCQMVGPETARPSVEYGAPLCREADIEKWKGEEETVRKRRKSILH